LRRVLVALVLLAVGFGACSPGGEAEDSTTSTGVSTTTTATTPASTSTTSTTTTTTLPTTTTIASTTTTLPPFPPERQGLEHGGDAWVVVLPGSDDLSDPTISEATQAAEDAGYSPGVTDCDLGAAEALGQPAGTFTVSVYLNSEADAETARTAFEARGVAGVVTQVQTFCLD
jgi:hypothetical protein